MRTSSPLGSLPKTVCLFLVLSLALSACSGAVVAIAEGGETGGYSEGEATTTPTPEEASDEVEPEGERDGRTPVPSEVQEETGPTPTPTPASVNPLTGEPVDDPAALCGRPVLVAVSNFPPSSRPQSGLSAASQVWETFIGEGMTRFLAVYYGPYLDELEAAMENRLLEGSAEGTVIGPVRSGRVVFEDIKTMFAKGILITAGASSEVMSQLSNRESVYASDPEDINSAGLNPADLTEITGCAVEPSMYGDLAFDPQPPAGGEPGEFFRLVYNLFNQIGWKYDPESGAYLRSQDRADGTGELYPAVEGLTGEQLAFENVLVMWAKHRYVTRTIIEMELVYTRDRYGLLFRDGKVYEVRWSTPSGRMLVHDKEGEPIPLKPGSTFFEVVSYQSTWDAAEKIVRYHNPPVE